MANGVAQSFGVLNYSGQLFDKTNTDTPLVANLPRRDTNSVEFVINSTYATEAPSIPSISETASLTAPEATYVTRAQETNVAQIFQYSTGVSYQKQANTGTLAGVNIAGQQNNVPNEFDFQMAVKTKKARTDLEYTLINGTYNKATTDAEVNKTRGLIEAIKTNTQAAASGELTFDLLNKLLRTMFKNNAPTDGLIILCDAVTKAQITNNWSKLPGYFLPQSRNVGGIAIDQIITDLGTLGVMVHRMVPAGTALLVNMSVLEIVEMPIPGKGNFFWEPLAKTGAGDKGQLYGTAGLDYGPEWYHGKITGLSTEVADLTPPAAEAAGEALNVKP